MGQSRKIQSTSAEDHVLANYLAAMAAEVLQIHFKATLYTARSVLHG
jgi:hypothetical protein